MIDRKDYPRMLVSNDEENWEQRIVLFVNKNNSCIIVEKEYEQYFLDMGNFELLDRNYCKPLPEKIEVTQYQCQRWADQVKGVQVIYDRGIYGKPTEFSYNSALNTYCVREFKRTEEEANETIRPLKEVVQEWLDSEINN